jgi:hypothetical protein
MEAPEPVEFGLALLPGSSQDGSRGTAAGGPLLHTVACVCVFYI